MTDDQALVNESRKLAIGLMVELGNLLHGVSSEERDGFMIAVTSLVEALDNFPPEYGARCIFAPHSEKLIVVFDDCPEMEPIIIQLEVMEND